MGTFRVDLPPVAVEGRRLIPGLRAQGMGPVAIARHLNAIGASTPSGRGRWHPETVTRHSDPTYRWRNMLYMRDYRARHSA